MTGTNVYNTDGDHLGEIYDIHVKGLRVRQPHPTSIISTPAIIMALT